MKQISLPDFLVRPDPNVYLGENYLVLDFETTNKDKGSALNSYNRLVYTSYKYKGETFSNWDDEFNQQLLTRNIKAADFIVAHNAKFELQWLARCGLDLESILVYDTMLGEYVLGGNRWKYHQLSLDKLAKKYFKEGKLSVISYLLKAGVCPLHMPKSWLGRYGDKDVDLTERIFLEQRKKLSDKELLPVQYNRCLLTPVLADIESNGICLDPEAVAQVYEDNSNELAVAERELNKITGGINLNSPKQVQEFLYDTLGLPEIKVKKAGRWVPKRTPKGGRATDKETIMALKPKTDRQKEFISKYRHYSQYFASVSKYLRKWMDCIEESKGILMAHFNQMATFTHRLSSSGAKYKTQFQNMPRVFKRLIRARRKGWVIGEVDGAQLEFRIACHAGRDEQGLADILDPNFDSHVTSGAVIANKDILRILELYRAGDKAATAIRQDGKAHTFKPLYGGKSGTEDEKRYYQYFQDRYAGITETQESWIREVLNTGKLVTECGLVYYWPGTKMDPRSGYVDNTTSICNYPVQGFATAEIIPMAMVFFWHRLKRSDLKMFIINTVHDSIIAEFPEEETEQFHALSQQCLIEDVYVFLDKLYGIKLTIPLGCGVKVGTNWGTGEEVTYEADKHWYAND